MAATITREVRAIWEGEILSSRTFDEGNEHVADAYYSSTLDNYRRRNDDETCGVTVQMIDHESDAGDIIAEHYFDGLMWLQGVDAY